MMLARNISPNMTLTILSQYTMQKRTILMKSESVGDERLKRISG